MKKLFSVLAFGILTSGVSIAAPVVVVNYEINYDSYPYKGVNYGQFSGVDLNNDGLIVFSELNDWYIISESYNPPRRYNIDALNDIGDFDYRRNRWFNNGRRWDQVTRDAYVTWDNWINSWNTEFDHEVLTSVAFSNGVPEPSSMALVVSGLLGVGVLRRRRSFIP